MQPPFLLFGDIMFKPDFIFKTPTEISAEFLKKNDIKALLLDVDNTMSVAHGDKTLRDGVREWLSDMSREGIGLIILSNSNRGRAKAFADAVGLPVVALAAKPLPFGYIRASKKLGVKRKNIAMVGDQIFTDTLGANLSGVRAVLVTDITPEDKLGFKIKRYFERIMLKRWKNVC